MEARAAEGRSVGIRVRHHAITHAGYGIHGSEISGVACGAGGCIGASEATIVTN